VDRVTAEFSKAEAFHSSGRIRHSIEAVRTAFDGGVEAVLGELKRTIQKKKLNPKELRQHAEQPFSKFANGAKDVARIDGSMGLDLRPRLAEFDQHLEFALRQFDVGFFDRPEPENPPIANAITIETMTGSVIQQGSPGATQTVQQKVDVKSVTTALNTLESELSRVQIDNTTLTELRLAVGRSIQHTIAASPGRPGSGAAKVGPRPLNDLRVSVRGVRSLLRESAPAPVKIFRTENGEAVLAKPL
jgi:hypothetical protein